MESAAPQTPVQALEALQNAYSRFLDALPEARRASLGEAIGFFLRSDGNPKLGSLVDAFAEELPVHVEALKTRLAACPAEEADRLATQALELMLLYPRPKDGATEFSLAAFEGFAAPLLRSVLFGMPPMYPIAIAMAFELATYGAVAGFMYRKVQHTLPMIYTTLVTSMVAGRLVWGAVRFVLAGLSGSSFPFSAFLSGAVLTAVPGIVAQLILIPLIVAALQKAKLTD